MSIKNSVGRPMKIDVRTSARLADALRNNYNITDACKWARVGRTTYYRYMNNNPVFAAQMNHAIEGRNKVSFSFGTSYRLN